MNLLNLYSTSSLNHVFDICFTEKQLNPKNTEISHDFDFDLGFQFSISALSILNFVSNNRSKNGFLLNFDSVRVLHINKENWKE